MQPNVPSVRPIDMLPGRRVLLAVVVLAGLVGYAQAGSGPPLEPGVSSTDTPHDSSGGTPRAAPTLQVELRLVGLLFIEGGFGVVSVSDGPGGSELARGAVPIGESGTRVVLEVAAGELEVRAWTHGCEPSGCTTLSEAELDALRPGADDLCTTIVTVPRAEPAQQAPTRTRLLYQYGVLAPTDTRTSCRLEVV